MELTGSEPEGFVGRQEELASVHKEYYYYYTARGRPEEAEKSIQTAIDMFDKMGMKLWADQCRGVQNQ